MSRIKFILFWLGAFCITNLSFGQQETKPAKCTNPGGGILVGGAFNITPGVGCLDFQTNSATPFVSNALTPTGGTNFTNLGYIFNFKDGDNINFPTTLETSKVFSKAGTYWILQGMNSNGTAYITCNSFELIQTEVPDVNVSSCGTNEITLTFKKSTVNDKHDGYRIIWGDGNQDFIQNITPTSFPFTKRHIYNGTPSGQPSIVGLYSKGCSTSPSPFNFNVNSKPKISELEGLTGGTSNKITMTEGTDGRAYTIEQRPKTGTWTDNSVKITRNTGETFKTETLTGFNSTTEYCFRLKTADGCGNPIYSNEVCTIVLKETIISSKDVKLDWNAPDPGVTRYSIGMLQSDGLTNNFGTPSPSITTYTYDAMDCKKQYEFNVTAFIGATPADRVLIKSPSIAIDPSKTPKFPAKEIAQVSIQNSSLIRVTVFEPFTKAANYIFYRAEGDLSKYEEVKRTTNNFYEDLNVEPDKQQYCYKVVHQDNCGNSSQMSEAFCSIYLNSEKANTLNWTKYNANPSAPTPLPVIYYIDAIDGNGNYNQVDNTFNTYQDVKNQIDRMLDNPDNNGKAKFQIRAIQEVKFKDKDGNESLGTLQSLSNEYIFITPAQLYIPTAFSPNADGFNELFEVKGKFIVQFTLQIYDRWGNIIFESQDLGTGWNGTANDGVTPAPAGNYGFKVFGLDPAGQKFEKVGSITLIR